MTRRGKLRDAFWGFAVVATFSVAMAMQSAVGLLVYAAAVIVSVYVLGRVTTLRDHLRLNLDNPSGAFLLAAGVGLAGLPIVQSGQQYTVYAEASAFGLAIPVLGLFLTLGMAGMVDLGLGAFAGIGAYSAARSSMELGVSPFLTPFIGGATALLVAGILGHSFTRARSHYFAVATLGLGLIGQNVFIQWPALTGGVDGIGGIPAPNAIGSVQLDKYYWSLACMVFVLLLVTAIKNGHWGRCLKAARDNELAAASCGVEVGKSRMWAYAISAFIVGFGGAIYAHTVNYIAPGDFGLQYSTFIVALAVLAGTKHPLYGVLAALGMTVLQEKLREFGDLRMLLLSAALLGVVIVRARRADALARTYPER